MIWEPFVFALVLGIIISAGLYAAYLWPQIEPVEPVDAPGDTAAATSPTAPGDTAAAAPGDATRTAPATTTDPAADAAP